MASTKCKRIPHYCADVCGTTVGCRRRNRERVREAGVEWAEVNKGEKSVSKMKMSKFSHPQLTSQAQTDLDLVCWGSIPHWSTLQRYVYSTAGICNAWWRLFSDPLLPFGTGTWCLTPILMRSRSLSLFVNMCHLVFMCHMSSSNWRAMLIFPSMTYSSYTTGRACVGVENTITLLINQRYPHTLTCIWFLESKQKGWVKYMLANYV